jgi:hypothetical protein
MGFFLLIVLVMFFIIYNPKANITSTDKPLDKIYKRY